MFCCLLRIFFLMILRPPISTRSYTLLPYPTLFRSWARAARFWRRAPNSFRIGAVILLVHLLVAATGPVWAPYGLSQMGTGIPLSGMSWRSEEHTSELQSLMRNSYAVFCLKKNKHHATYTILQRY